FECNLDNAGFAACPSTANGVAGTNGSIGYNGLADGSHSIEVRAADSTGNIGAIASYSWTIDLVAPVLTVPAATVTAESALGGVVHVAYTASAADDHDP